MRKKLKGETWRSIILVFPGIHLEQPIKPMENIHEDGLGPNRDSNWVT